jgi:cysteinyl-tRNA synthetase
MTEITLYNTKSRKKERFSPLDPDNVRMYVCGPTVYDRAHLGNARPVVVFDVLYRLLRHVAAEHGWGKVTYVRNFTDVDDKINARAKENVGEGGDVNAEIARLTAQTTQWFLDDMGALGALEPDQMPRATQFIPQMVAMIGELIEKGHAYEAEGHVLFAVDSWKERYGNLSGRSVDDMIAGARVEVAPYKRNPMDFVLWKPSSDDLPGWESPWGRGRPGWHIECSAMSYELLGDSFDIHGGGNDLMFPHHENEIAQSCCAHPEGEFARVWMHNEMLQVEGKKMSKSLGNFFTVHDLLEKGYPGEVIRFVFLSTHYRKPMDWTEAKAREARKTLAKWRKLLSDAGAIETSGVEADEAVVAALSDDLNTSQVLTVLRELGRNLEAALKSGNQHAGGDTKYPASTSTIEEAAAKLKVSAGLIGLLTDVSGEWASIEEGENSEALLDLTERLATARMAAMTSKDFSEVDRLKSALLEAGVEVRMGKEGVELLPGETFDPAKLEALK